MDGEITEILLNGMEIPFLIAMLLSAFAGIVVFFIIEVKKAIKYDMRTPKKFDFKTMIKMSCLRILLAVIVVPLAIVYFGDFSTIVFHIDTPLEMNAFVAFWLGVSIDKLIDGLIGGSKEGFTYFKNNKP